MKLIIKDIRPHLFSILSRYSGNLCALCRDEILIGDLIQKVTITAGPFGHANRTEDQERDHWVHADCIDKVQIPDQPQRPRADLDATLKADLRKDLEDLDKGIQLLPPWTPEPKPQRPCDNQEVLKDLLCQDA